MVRPASQRKLIDETFRSRFADPSDTWTARNLIKKLARYSSQGDVDDATVCSTEKPSWQYGS